MLLFITIVLQAFLLLGCVKPSSTYSSVFLTEYRFNSTSEIYPKIQSGLNSNHTNLSSMSIRAGYLSFCVKLADSGGSSLKNTCASYNAAESLADISGLNLLGKDSQLNLVHIVQKFSEICHPRILMASCIMVMITLILLCYLSIPFVPGKSYVIMGCFALNTLNLLTFGLGSMLQNEAVSTSKSLVPAALMNIILVNTGARASAMTWTSFLFIFSASVGCVYLVVMDTRQQPMTMKKK